MTLREEIIDWINSHWSSEEKADAILKACRDKFNIVSEEYQKRGYIVTIPDGMEEDIFGGENG